MESAKKSNLAIELETIEKRYNEKVAALQNMISDETENYLRHRLEIEKSIIRSQVEEEASSDRLMTAKEAAEFINVKLNYIYQLVNRKEIIPQRIGSKVIRFRKSELMDYMNGVRRKSDIDRMAEEYLTTHRSPITGR